MKRKDLLREWYDRRPENNDAIGTRSQEMEGFSSLLHSLPLLMGKALDVACGTGTYTFMLAEQGFDVTAVDISKKSISKLQSDPRYTQHGIHASVIDDAKNLPFAKRAPTARNP